MIKISKLSDYAIVVLSELSRARGQIVTATMLSQSTRIPEPTVAKVLKILSKHDIVQSTRGAHGGYHMARDPQSITVHELIVALEGPVAITSCAHNSTDRCKVEEFCTVRGGWQKINDAVIATLDGIFLTDLITQSVAQKTPMRKER